MNGVFLLLAVCTFVFALVCVFRVLDCVKQSREEADAIERWWRQRAEAREAALMGSSLADDANSVLPERFEKPKDAA